MGLPSNVILVGFMGAGKTTTGKELARLMKVGFLDTDNWIEEKNGSKVSDIFNDRGEAFFRSQEKEAIEWLKTQDGRVVSMGGGAWMNAENRSALLGIGWCAWLKVSVEVAWKRVATHLSQRPILSKTANSFETLKSLWIERVPIYSLAPVSFDTDGKTSKEVALEIFERLKEEHPFDLPSLQK